MDFITRQVLLVVEEGVWRDVEVVNVGDVVRGLSEWAFVWAHACEVVV